MYVRLRVSSWNLAWGKGTGSNVCGHILKRLHQMSKVILRLKNLRNALYLATKFTRKNPWPERSALLLSKVTHGSSGVTKGLNCLAMPYGHYIWQKHLTRVEHNVGVKGHIGVILGKLSVMLLRIRFDHPIWLQRPWKLDQIIQVNQRSICSKKRKKKEKKKYLWTLSNLLRQTNDQHEEQ